MDTIPGKKPKTEGVSRSGRVRKKSSKLMDFESPDEIERSFKKTPTVAARKSDYFEGTPSRKVPKFQDAYLKEEREFPSFDEGSAESDYASEHDQPVQTTESSIDSLGSESEFDDGDMAGGFKKLDSDSSKKRLLIKDGRIVKDKSKVRSDVSPPKYKPLGAKGTLKPLHKKISTNKISPTSLQPYQFGGMTSYENINISPPSPRGKEPSFKVNGIKPIDVAAHLKLLGESLTIIGERLKEHEGQIAVSGSLSVLLDSLLCALGPLICLTQQIPELKDNCCSTEQLISTLDNVAFIMPGL